MLRVLQEKSAAAAGARLSAAVALEIATGADTPEKGSISPGFNVPIPATVIAQSAAALESAFPFLE